MMVFHDTVSKNIIDRVTNVLANVQWSMQNGESLFPILCKNVGKLPRPVIYLPNVGRTQMNFISTLLIIP